jgi:hypothetical protein
MCECPSATTWAFRRKRKHLQTLFSKSGLDQFVVDMPVTEPTKKNKIKKERKKRGTLVFVFNTDRVCFNLFSCFGLQFQTCQETTSGLETTLGELFEEKERAQHSRDGSGIEPRFGYPSICL